MSFCFVQGAVHAKLCIYANFGKAPDSVCRRFATRLSKASLAKRQHTEHAVYKKKKKCNDLPELWTGAVFTCTLCA